MNMLWIIFLLFIFAQCVLGISVFLVARNIFSLKNDSPLYLFNPLALFRKVSFSFIDKRLYLKASSWIGNIRYRQWLLVHLNAAYLRENKPGGLIVKMIAHILSLHYLWKNPTDELIEEKLLKVQNFIDDDLAYLICEKNKFLQEQRVLDESGMESLRLQARQGMSNCEGFLAQSIIDEEFMKAQVAISFMFYYAQFLRTGDINSDKWRQHNVEILENVTQYYRKKRIGRWCGIEIPQLYEGSAVFQGIRYLKRVVRTG